MDRASHRTNQLMTVHRNDQGNPVAKKIDSRLLYPSFRNAQPPKTPAIRFNIIPLQSNSYHTMQALMAPTSIINYLRFH
jgi:hypothetical protein